MVPASNYSERFADAMRLSGLTAHDIAKAVGITYQAVKKILAGTSGMLKADNNSVAAKAMRVNSDWLATGEAAPPQPVWSEDAENLARVCDSITDLRERDRFIVVTEYYARLAINGQLSGALDGARIALPELDTKPEPDLDEAIQTAAAPAKQSGRLGAAR